MKRLLRKIVCIFLCLLVTASSLSRVAFAGGDFAYPEGVTAEQALNAVESTDRLIAALSSSFGGGDVSAMLSEGIYTDEAVSSVLISIYTSLNENGGDLSYIGIDGSVRSVASYLSAYPKVSETLAKFNSWEEVDPTALEWGVSDKESFADAMGTCFAPFNDILYTLLCSGTFEINRFIKIEGADGYKNAVIPMLQGMGCTPELTQAEFTAQADRNKATMVKNILLPLLNMVESCTEAPVSSLTDLLPRIAYFVKNGGMDACINTLLEPVTSNKLVEVATLLKIFDLETMSIDFEAMLNEGMSEMSKEGGMALASIVLDDLAACGTMNGDTFVSDKGKAYVVIMRWVIETLKLNSANMDAITNSLGMASTDMSFINDMLSKDTDTIVATLIGLFTPAEIGQPQAMVYPSVSPRSVSYTPNLTEKDYERALKEIDELLNDFVKEGGTANKMGEVIAAMIFTNENINSLMLGIYGALEENGLVPMLALMGIDATPGGVARCFTSEAHQKAAAALNKADTWADVSLKGVRWGFGSGSRSGFQEALTATLRPLYPVLKLLLAEEDMVLLNSITIKGADGYNTAVIPILEGLGCRSYYIKSYDSYKRDLEGDGVIENVLDPVFNLLDEICDKPVYSLTELLPNIIYFFNSGSLESCVNNLMLPVTALGEKFSGVVDMNIDATALTGEISVDSLLSGMISSGGMKLAKLDLDTIANLGTPVQRTSKSVINGQRVTYTYVEANQTGVFITLLRFLAETMKLPGNEDMLMGAMGSGDAGGMASYGASLSDKFADMTTDELIEWLYNLFFKERVKAQIVVKDDYMPTIIFEEAKPDYTWLYCVGAYAFVSLIAGAILFFNRKRLY